MKAEKRKVSDLVRDPANLRLHGSRNIEAIKASLKRFGQQKPIVVDGDGVVRAGNGTLEAATALGWDDVWAIESDLEGVDLTAYSIADNRTGELAEWDREALAKVMAAMPDDLTQAAGFTDKECEVLAHVLELMSKEEESNQDEQEEVPEPETDETKVIATAGDVWILGDHRVMCGDARNKDHVDALLGEKNIAVAVTSPPYASQRKYDETTEFKPIPADEYVVWFNEVQLNVHAHLAHDGSWFVNIKEHCEDGQRVLYVKDLTLAHVRKWGWRFVDEYAWTHGGTPRGVVRRFKNGWEPIFHFTRGEHKFRPEQVRHLSGNVPEWTGGSPSDDFRQGTGESMVSKGEGVGGMQGRGDALATRGARISKVNQHNASVQGEVGALPPGYTVEEGLAFPSNCLSLGKNREALGHAAAFPVKLPAFFIKAYSDKGDLIYDPFLGSGSTLIAAQNEERVCYGMEISPAYCDVIVKRWENLTGETAVKA